MKLSDKNSEKLHFISNFIVDLMSEHHTFSRTRRRRNRKIYSRYSNLRGEGPVRRAFTYKSHLALSLNLKFVHSSSIITTTCQKQKQMEWSQKIFFLSNSQKKLIKKKGLKFEILLYILADIDVNHFFGHIFRFFVLYFSNLLLDLLIGLPQKLELQR